MSKSVDFLLIGGGLASATAVETLRSEGATGSILILSAENMLPYQRPPLSSRYLLSKLADEKLLILKKDYYDNHNIEVALNKRVIAVDAPANKVITQDSQEYTFGKLLIATGSRPLSLDVPGSELKGIYRLRDIEDAKQIQSASANSKKIVIVGASFMGMELAASLTKKGLQVTLLATRDTLFDKLKSHRLSRFFGEEYLKHGVKIILEDTVQSYIGTTQVKSVLTRSGKKIDCDFVVLGVGVTPEVEFLEKSGLELSNGIKVDRYLQTNYSNIFAAGDVANFYDPVFNVQRRVEHWDNAIKQGRLAAKNMLGQRLPYEEVSYFFCDTFDTSFQFLGKIENTTHKIELGSLEKKSYALLYMQNNIPRAVFSIGRPPKETRAIEALIRYRVNLKDIESKLDDPDFSIETIPHQTVLILQGGGALGAFECGTVQALEERQIYPDIVAGVSIGAFNGAIIAANPKNATNALKAFWEELAIYSVDVPNDTWRRIISSWHSVMLGIPNFFTPRWLSPPLNFNDLQQQWTSFYDTAPIKKILTKYVDFDFLKNSPVRLLVSAVNIENASLEIFDSYVDNFTADHIVASGSLPPGFPWTTINGKHYWDGGIISNSPLEAVNERSGTAGKRVFVVDLFPSKKTLPDNLMEVMVRRDEIVYSERIKNDTKSHAVIRDYQKLVEEILGYVDPSVLNQITQRPRYIQLMGDHGKSEITRITREAHEHEPSSKDYDFSQTSIQRHIQEGYEMAKKALSNS